MVRQIVQRLPQHENMGAAIGVTPPGRGEGGGEDYRVGTGQLYIYNTRKKGKQREGTPTPDRTRRTRSRYHL